MAVIPVDRYLAEKQEMSDLGDWYLHEEKRSKITQHYIDSNNTTGLINFYTQALGSCLSKVEIKLVADLTPKIDILCRKIQDQLDIAVDQISGKIKALYFEYGYDEGHFYLCNQYSPKSPDWASCFVSETECIDTTGVQEFYDWDLEANKESILRDYIDAMMVTALVGKSEEIDLKNMKLGFAEHDWHIVIIR